MSRMSRSLANVSYTRTTLKVHYHTSGSRCIIDFTHQCGSRGVPAAPTPRQTIYPFSIRMIKIRKHKRKPRELPGPLSGPWIPAVKVFGFGTREPFCDPPLSLKILDPPLPIVYIWDICTCICKGTNFNAS